MDSTYCVFNCLFPHFRNLKEPNPYMNAWARQTPLTFPLYIKYYWKTERKEKGQEGLQRDHFKTENGI